MGTTFEMVAESITDFDIFPIPGWKLNMAFPMHNLVYVLPNH